MLKVAITGNIASGKSAVEDSLRKKGFNVLDTDVVAHNLMLKESVKSDIASSFKGYDIFDSESGFDSNYEISRPKLGKIIFADKALREKLEGILHPRIKEEVRIFFQSQEQKDEKIAFVSAPLLFEAKFEELFDKIILVCADDKTRLERLIKRNNLSLDDAKKRLDSQISQDKKISLADYVIYNDKSLVDLYKEVQKVIELL